MLPTAEVPHKLQDLWRMEGAGLPLVLFSVLSFEQSGHCASQPDEVCATVTLFYK